MTRKTKKKPKNKNFFAAAWSSQPPPIDLNWDGSFDNRDLLILINEWLICNRWPQTECWK